MKNKFELFSKLSIFMSSHKILGFFKYVYYYFDRIICIFIKKSKEISEKKQIIINHIFSYLHYNGLYGKLEKFLIGFVFKQLA